MMVEQTDNIASRFCDEGTKAYTLPQFQMRELVSRSATE